MVAARLLVLAALLAHVGAFQFIQQESIAGFNTQRRKFSPSYQVVLRPVGSWILTTNPDTRPFQNTNAPNLRGRGNVQQLSTSQYTDGLATVVAIGAEATDRNCDNQGACTQVNVREGDLVLFRGGVGCSPTVENNGVYPLPAALNRRAGDIREDLTTVDIVSRYCFVKPDVIVARVELASRDPTLATQTQQSDDFQYPL